MIPVGALVGGMLAVRNSGKPSATKAKMLGKLYVLEAPNDLGTACGALVAIAATLSSLAIRELPPPSDVLRALAIASGFLPFFAWLILSSHGRRVAFDDCGIELHSGFFRVRRLAWRDLTHVRFSRMRATFVLRVGQGRPMRIPATFIGMATFARVLSAHMPEHVVRDRSTKRILAQLANADRSTP